MGEGLDVFYWYGDEWLFDFVCSGWVSDISDVW